MDRYPRLFEPIRLGSLELANRIVMAPMTSGYPLPDGTVGDRLIAYYRTRAAGGVGLIIVEGCLVHPRGKGWLNHLSCWDDRYLPGLAQLARAIRGEGARSILQLIHCGRQTSSRLLDGLAPVAPSPLPCPRMREAPHELTTGEIAELVEAFALGAKRTKQAGFDGVELHAAHGYLINEFLSPYSNVREDRYGRDEEGRLRFLLEIARRVRELCGEDFPVTCRLSGHEFVEGGIEPPLAARYCRRLEEAGVASVHLSAGVYGSNPALPMTAGTGEGTLAWIAGEVKRAVTIPVIAVGRIITPEAAERILAEGKSDLVALGRALIADPAWPAKARSGKEADIIPCIGCNVCQMRPKRPGIICIVNPETGREEETVIVPAREPRRVAILGSGLPGLEAARVLALRGHKVTVFEGTDRLGGAFGLRSLAPGWEEFGSAVSYLVRQCEKLGVEFRLGEDYPARLSAEAMPQATIWAKTSRLPAKTEVRVEVESHDAVDILAGESPAARNVVVAGGRCLEAETALVLASRGHNVRLFEEGPEVASDTHRQIAYQLKERLSRAQVEIWTGARLRSVTAEAVEADVDGKRTFLVGSDALVQASGEEVTPAERLAELGGEFQNLIILGDAYQETLAACLVYQANLIARGL